MSDKNEKALRLMHRRKQDLGYKSNNAKLLCVKCGLFIETSSCEIRLIAKLTQIDGIERGNRALQMH